jgi:hypothetical protein
VVSLGKVLVAVILAPYRTAYEAQTDFGVIAADVAFCDVGGSLVVAAYRACSVFPFDETLPVEGVSAEDSE